MSAALVSVIVAVHDGERTLAAALDSIFAQAHRPIEVLVVDDGSADRSAEIARSYADVRVLQQPCAGVAAARNAALAIARGAFIAFLDQDDRWLAGKLTRQLQCFADEPLLGLVFAHERIVLDGVAAPPRWLRDDALSEDLPTHIPSVLLARRSVFERIGNFDARFVNGSDTDWIFRARDAGVLHTTLPETLLLRRVHAHNASHQVAQSRSDIFQALHDSIRRKRGARS